MFIFDKIDIQDKKKFYAQLNIYLENLIGEEKDWLPGISNASALLYQLMPEINWAGFYLSRGEELVLGPFQGKPACIRIPFGKGVCGTAAITRKIQVVKDVNEFPGHIACDAASQSEIVVPIIKDERLLGVLDIDSPVKNRFDEMDAEGLSSFVDILNQRICWPQHTDGITAY